MALARGMACSFFYMELFEATPKSQKDFKSRHKSAILRLNCGIFSLPSNDSIARTLTVAQQWQHGLAAATAAIAAQKTVKKSEEIVKKIASKVI